jgi:hypothetical protein
MVTSFCGEVRSLILGLESYERLIQQCRPAYKRFTRNIRGTAPKFQPYQSTDRNRGVMSVEDYAEIPHEDEDEDEDVDVKAPMYLDDVRRHIEKYYLLIKLDQCQC